MIHGRLCSLGVSALATDRITAFIPVKHYHEGFLRQAIDSVVQQTRGDWQLLIVAEDATLSHFRELLRATLADPRVRLIARTGRLLAGAYNSAMRAADTAFIAVLLGDDRWAPEAVAELGRCIREHPDADFFHSGRIFIDGKNQVLSSAYLPTRPVAAENFVEGSPVKHLLCWRVSKGLACGGVDETLENFGSDDYDFPWTMLDHGAAFHAVPLPLYLFRDHRDGVRLTTHVPRSVQERSLRRILEKHGTPPSQVRARLRAARRNYLRQSLFRNVVHRWALSHVGVDARRGWRESYR